MLNSIFLFKNFLILFSVILLLGSCSEDESIKEDEILIEPEVLKINSFVQQNMNSYYLWESKMPILNVSQEKDTREYFDKLLYKHIDRWSYITDDAKALGKYFEGVRKEFGYSLRLMYLSEGSNRVVGFIEYVEPNGPADRAGLKRGDFVIKMNGGAITDENYLELFDSDNITIGLGSIVGGTIYDLPPNVNLTSEEIHVNPILVNKVFEKGGKKIGYLAYTSFIHEYNDNLKSVFADLKNQGVSELILDLRYNGGGAVSTAKLMASMICPKSCFNNVFLRTAYNEELERAFLKKDPDENFEDYFESNESNLNLSNLYVLTTGGTASASEMVIYSLSPYMNVIQIGEQTHGKYYGSITIDNEKEHNWAIQPIVMRAENVDNSIDYSKGLVPDHEMEDDFSFELGDSNEKLTAFAISLITGSTFKAQESLKSAKSLGLVPSNSFYKKENQLKYEMYIEMK